MADETKDLTRQEQLEQWVEMIKECESRSKEMSIDEWCKQHGLSRNVYFYRKREVVKAGLLPEKNKKKKDKSKSKKTTKKKNTPAIETAAVDATVQEPTTVEEPTEETPAPVEEPAKEESAVEESTPAVESAVVEKDKEEPAMETVVEEPTPAEESAVVEESPAIDITIGSATIHVNEKTSPELLSMVVQTIVPIMKSNEKTPLKDLPELKEFLAKINIANVTIEQSKGTEK